MTRIDNPLGDGQLAFRVFSALRLRGLVPLLEQICDLRGVNNYEILGNTDPFLHAHIIPRYEHEPEALRSKPAFLYPRDRWTDPTWQYDETAHGELRAALERELKRRIAEHA